MRFAYVARVKDVLTSGEIDADDEGAARSLIMAILKRHGPARITTIVANPVRRSTREPTLGETLGRLAG